MRPIVVGGSRFNFGVKLWWLILLLVCASVISLFLISNTHIPDAPLVLDFDKNDALKIDSELTTTLSQPPTTNEQQQQQEQKPSGGKSKSRFVKIPNVVGEDDVNEDPIVKQRRLAILEAIKHSYKGYADHCFGRAELKPVTGGCHDWIYPGISLTAIDSLDTLLIAGLDDEYDRTMQHLKNDLNWDKNMVVSVFETTIRCLGGFLTAYEITQDEWLLDSAKALADRLLPAFSAPSGLPRALINLQTGVLSEPNWMSNLVVLAEVGTLQLEFGTLSYLTKDLKYTDKATRVYDALKSVMPDDYLYPCFLSPFDGKIRPSTISLGGLGDSFYEYLLKFWLINNKFDSGMKDWYYKTADSIIQNLGVKAEDGLWFLAEKYQNGNLLYKMDHLACFAGGMFALGAQYIDDPDTKNKHMEVAEGIGKFCWLMYNQTKTGLSGEHVLVTYVEGKKITMDVGGSARSWIMRPEAMETWFILWRLTKKPIYREWGWQIFQSMNKYSRTTYGYSGIRDVQELPPVLDDTQQSFFLAETLKYLYLLYTADDVIPLDRFIFNTEAHPLLVFED